jgi:hypothetical protein
MVTDDQSSKRQQTQPEDNGMSVGRSRAFRLAALTLAVVSCSASGFLMFDLLGGAHQENSPADPATPLFQLWPRDRQPDVVLMLTGETIGYMQPCGCSKPQYGGLERRYNFLQNLVKERRWQVVALDLGDVAQKSGPQAAVKYRYGMEALRRLGYTAVGIGRNEMAMPLIDALSEYSLNNEWPRVLAANLLKKVEKFPSGSPGKSMVRSWEVAAQESGPRVGVVGVVGGSVIKEVRDPDVGFEAVERALPEALKEIAVQKPDLLVLLFQGPVEEANKIAARFPQFQVILALADDPDPPSVPERVGNTSIVTVGHKGRFVGVVGAYRTGKADPLFELHYQLVKLGPEYETPAGQEATNPILALLENYTKEVKAANYLSHYSKSDHPLQRVYKGATYVGSDKCKRCHDKEYEIWKASPHAHAYETLTKAQRPGLRQFDGECVRCHVTGFDYTAGFKDDAGTPLLKDVGCENCHGPGSAHVKDNLDPKLLALMNPYKSRPEDTKEKHKEWLNRLGLSCQKCHDGDNDVHWDPEKWDKGKIAH